MRWSTGEKDGAFHPNTFVDSAEGHREENLQLLLLRDFAFGNCVNDDIVHPKNFSENEVKFALCPYFAFALSSTQKMHALDKPPLNLLGPVTVLPLLGLL